MMMVSGKVFEKVTLEFNAARPVTIYDKVYYIDMSSLRKHLYVAQLLLSGDSTQLL